MDNLTTYAENTWCPGCGNFGIFNAFKRAVRNLEDVGVKKDNIIISTGIGCHGKIFDYLALSGFYSLHGRSVATIQGIKIANPDLKVIDFCGDGDGMGEGLAHMIFAAKRNADITVVMHNNGVYGLTTGQFTPTSEKGVKTPSSPFGNIEEPFNPLTLMLEAGASFIARGYSGKIDHLTEIIVSAVKHKGFSFIDVLQPCVSFNNTYQKYNDIVEILNDAPKSYEESIEIARKKDKLAVGIIYKEDKPVYHNNLYGDWNPVKKSLLREDRIQRIKKLI